MKDMSVDKLTWKVYRTSSPATDAIGCYINHSNHFFCPQMVTNSSIFFLSVLTSGMGFDLQKCEYSSANRAHSKATSMQAELSIYEVLVATKFSKVHVLGILHSVSKNQCSDSQLFWNNPCKYCLPILLIAYFPTGHSLCSHLTSTINT